MHRQVYLDHNASTPIAPEVADAMRPLLESAFGNPSSGHWGGRPAREAIETGRSSVAALLGADADEIVFTSGASEAINTALKGVFWRRGSPGARIVISATEHPATFEACRFLEKMGAVITIVPVDRHGLVDPSAVAKEIDARTILLSVMHANNEVGTIQPIQALARIARERGVLFHVDAAQSAGKIESGARALGVDLMSIAGHKFYAPKGVGALYIRRGVELEPLIHGGGHEKGRRAGTESALLAVALGKACDLARAWVPRSHEIRALTDRLWDGLKDALGDRIALNGHPEERLPNTLNVGFVGRIGADVLALLPGIAASTGSACHAGAVELSPVLKAMGVRPEVGMGAIRFSLGRATTPDEIDHVLALVRKAVVENRQGRG